MVQKIEITSNRTSPVSILDSDSLLIIGGGIRVDTPGTAIDATGTATNREIDINGTVNTENGFAIEFGASSVEDSASLLVVGDTGIITSNDKGVQIRGGGFDLVNHGSIATRNTAISSEDKTVNLINNGTLSSLKGIGISSAGAKATIINNGAIDTEQAGVLLSGNNAGFTNNGTINARSDSAVISIAESAVISNNGKLTADKTVIQALARDAIVTNAGSIVALSASGILVKGDDTIVTNSGTIVSAKSGVTMGGHDGTFTNDGTITSKAYAVSVSNDGNIVTNNKTILSAGGVEVDGTDQAVSNYGTIKGTSVKLATIDFSGASKSSFYNYGSLKTGGDAFLGGNGVQSVFNTGTIKGNITLGGGNDYFDGTGGQVIGTVAGGKGNDVYVISDSTIKLVEAVKAGTDLVQSSVSFTLGANFENLTLNGKAKVNATGNTLDNQIHGNAGDNKIDGKAGKDTLWGHSGNDILTGGAGVDQFVFAKGDGKDTITDFNARGTAHDVLDLTGLPGIFNFNNLITHHATQVGNNVLIDALNGDSILLQNVKLAHLDKGDFLF